MKNSPKRLVLATVGRGLLIRGRVQVVGRDARRRRHRAIKKFTFLCILDTFFECFYILTLSAGKDAITMKLRMP